MSILKQLYYYLLQYPGIEIITDIDGDEGIFALFPYGDIEIKEYCEGKRQYTRRFLFLFKKGVLINSYGEESYSWVEDFFDWIEEQDYNYNYPNFGFDIIVNKLSISNLKIPDDEEKLLTGTYSAQLEIVYTKEE